jgi:hypothetical protein
VEQRCNERAASATFACVGEGPDRPAEECGGRHKDCGKIAMPNQEFERLRAASKRANFGDEVDDDGKRDDGGSETNERSSTIHPHRTFVMRHTRRAFSSPA